MIMNLLRSKSDIFTPNVFGRWHFLLAGLLSLCLHMSAFGIVIFSEFCHWNLRYRCTFAAHCLRWTYAGNIHVAVGECLRSLRTIPCQLKHFRFRSSVSPAKCHQGFSMCFMFFICLTEVVECLVISFWRKLIKCSILNHRKFDY